MPYTIPIDSNVTEQQFDVFLVDESFTIKILWNSEEEYFSMSIYNLKEEPLVENIKMVLNYPLVKRYKIDKMPKGEFYLLRLSGDGERATYDEIGKRYILVFVGDDEDAI